MSPRSKAPRPPRTQLRVGRLTKAHGLKGGMKIELYTDDPERRFQPGATFSLQVPTESPWHGKSLELGELRWYNGHPVAFFAGVADRTAAESLVKAILWVDHDPDEAPAEENAWYDHQLVGLRALRDGVEAGTVTRVEHFPAQDLLVVQAGDREVLVPFVAAIVPAVDIEAGTVTLTPPTGLFEDLTNPDPDPDAAEPQPEPAAPEPADPDPAPAPARIKENRAEEPRHADDTPNADAAPTETP